MEDALLPVLGLEDDGADPLDLHSRRVAETHRATRHGVELGEELPAAGHVMRGPAVEVPAVERLLVGAGVEEEMRARLVDVEGSRGLGADGFSLLDELEEAVGEE